MGRSRAIARAGQTEESTAREAAVQWTYDLRGLDLQGWAARAVDDLAAHRAAGDPVVLLVGDIQPDALAVLRGDLARAGHPSECSAVLGITALVLWSCDRPAKRAGDA